ncbi:LytR/AlgR family response regulator transcription factor [Lacinutrix jangbogonensis]|uniref:LytR/AlgR family response regulator transcription factor n=1 Tax=Lacinutrix jangbogonensis TaxID=1469557 RepID=UPI00053D332F|nr:LytTR family DNA-binding domain-containing protein [Lacinutrix jangbogonensis]
MQKISAVIVEDSRLARQELKELLKDHPEIEIIGEAENVDDAVTLIAKTSPALLFLDINMPEKDGFELLEALDEIPTVIFTTAYDEYAIKSFEYNAFDYLLKPINKDRFAKSIKKLLPILEEKDNTIETKALTENSQIFIKEGEHCWMVLLKDISLFEIVGNYTRVHFEDKKPLIYKSLNQIEAKLPESHFFRVNRQQIVNLKSIKNVTSWFNGKLKIALNDGNEVEVSRRQSQKFKQDLEF